MSTPVKKKGTGFCGVCGSPKTLGKDCAPCGRKAKAAYKKRNADKVVLARSAYKKRKHAEGAAARLAKKLAKKASAPARRRESLRAFKRRNPGKVNADTAKRFARKLQATPAWANDFFIKEVYALAALRTKMTGLKWHVDHEVPLRSKIVCGLHCEANLRVIPAVVNMRKGNRVWPDMP